MEDGSVCTIFRCDSVPKESMKLVAMKQFPNETVDEAIFKAYKGLASKALPDNGKSISE
jgi:hypothetical protein